MFRSTAPPSTAWLARRRPFSSTRVLSAPRPRRSAKLAPPLAPPMTLLSTVALWLAASRARACSSVLTPWRRRLSARSTVSGTVDSPSIWRRAEPVTSTRGSGAWAQAGGPAAARASSRSQPWRGSGQPRGREAKRDGNIGTVRPCGEGLAERRGVSHRVFRSVTNRTDRPAHRPQWPQTIRWSRPSTASVARRPTGRQTLVRWWPKGRPLSSGTFSRLRRPATMVLSV